MVDYLITAVGGESFFLAFRQGVVDAAQEWEGQGGVGVFAAPEAIADQVDDMPKEADGPAVVHISRIVHPPL